MTAVSDTSPICYLILIGEIEILPKLYSQVLVPTAIIAELKPLDAPAAVRNWTTGIPSWISVRQDPERSTLGMESLQVGEQASILLAESIPSDI